MNYTNHDLSFILYNNRSVDGVVRNFIPKEINPLRLIEIEESIDFFKSFFEPKRFVEIDISDMDVDSDDIRVNPNDISNLKSEILNSNLSDIELKFLIDRGVDQGIIEKYNLRGLSSISDKRSLEIINATIHPVLRKILDDGLEGGGIIIPLFEEQRLINCAIRKISDVGKLKYTLACPDVDVWGIDDVFEDDIWITEGLFDMMALRSLGLKSVSVSSAMWSGIQLLKLLDKKPKSINIFCDNDSVGLKTGFILKKFFRSQDIEVKTFRSKYFKDPSEHIFKNKMGVTDFEEIHIKRSMIESYPDNFNFLSYLRNRNF